MSARKTTASFAVRLLKPHTHAGQRLEAGAVIPAEALDLPIAEWLVKRGIGKKVSAATVPVAESKNTAEE